MSVTGDLRLIPPQVLQSIRESKSSSEFLAKLELYKAITNDEVKNLDQWESELRENFYSEDHIKILKSLQVDVVSTARATQSLFESAQIPRIDLNKAWTDMSSFLTGESNPDETPYIFSEKFVDDLSIPLINAVGGEAFKYKTGIYEAFITESDVKSIAKSLVSISENFAEEWNIRWTHLAYDMPGFEETDEESFYEFFSELTDFYQDADKQNSAIYICIC
jgi:hypothetical protein